MSLRKYGNQRDANEPEIIAALEKVGASVYPLDLPLDLLVGYRGKTYLVEVKSEKGRYTEGQEEFMETWRGQIDVVRSVDQALQAIGAIHALQEDPRN